MYFVQKQQSVFVIIYEVLEIIFLYVEIKTKTLYNIVILLSTEVM